MSTPKHFLTLSDLTSDELRGIISRAQALKALQREGIPHPVSYTHLTLPTTPYV